MDDFQECIEEYQECLEVVQICLNEDNTFDLSPCASQLEELSHSSNNNNNEYVKEVGNGGLVNNNDGETKTLNENNAKMSNVSESEAESFKSMCDKSEFRADTSQCNGNENKSKNEELSEKDGYETCVDESFSEETCAKSESLPVKNDDRTPTNSNTNVHQTATSVFANSTASEPCLKEQFAKIICLDSKLHDLKCYDNQDDSIDTDEFFLVQYPEDLNCTEVTKSNSELNVVERFGTPSRYQRRLFEYYNDYADCLESYKIYECNEDEKIGECVKRELSDEQIFSDIVLPFKSRSAPDIRDNSFVTLTYDPGPDKTRRKSAFETGHQCDLET